MRLSVPRPQVVRALAATLLVQSIVTMATLTVPVFAPAAADDIGVDASLIGVFASLVYLGAMTASLLSGGLVPRYGAIRMSQIGMAVSMAAIALTATGLWPAMALCAVFLGLGLGPATPASSHILARHTPAHLSSLVFSIKQTGVPIGGMLAGALVPLFVIAFGWRGAALAVAGMCALCIAAVQPTRRHFDTALRPDPVTVRGSVVGPLRLVLAHRALRRLCFASFFFAAIQQCFSVFLVTYLVNGLGMPFLKAGLTLSIAQASGVLARIVWGALADVTGRPQAVLGWLGVAMTGGGVAVALFTDGWAYGWIIAACVLLGATAVGWNGLFLSEVARIAPGDQASRATGGALFITFFGVVAGPPVFGATAAATGSYGDGFIVFAVLAGLSGLSVLRGSGLGRGRGQSGRSP